MSYEPHTLCNYTLKHLIEEGFITIKLIKISDATHKLVFDGQLVPNLPLKSEEIHKLCSDMNFIYKYAKVEGGPDAGEEWKVA